MTHLALVSSPPSSASGCYASSCCASSWLCTMSRVWFHASVARLSLCCITARLECAFMPVLLCLPWCEYLCTFFYALFHAWLSATFFLPPLVRLLLSACYCLPAIVCLLSSAYACPSASCRLLWRDAEGKNIKSNRSTTKTRGCIAGCVNASHRAGDITDRCGSGRVNRTRKCSTTDGTGERSSRTGGNRGCWLEFPVVKRNIRRTGTRNWYS